MQPRIFLADIGHDKTVEVKEPWKLTLLPLAAVPAGLVAEMPTAEECYQHGGQPHVVLESAIGPIGCDFSTYKVRNMTRYFATKQSERDATAAAALQAQLDEQARRQQKDKEWREHQVTYETAKREKDPAYRLDAMQRQLAELKTRLEPTTPKGD